MSMFKPADPKRFEKPEAPEAAPKPKPRIVHTERIVMIECEYCGFHEIERRVCVWAVTCPECGAEPGAYCTYQSGRTTMLHKERWDLADAQAAELYDSAQTTDS